MHATASHVKAPHADSGRQTLIPVKPLFPAGNHASASGNAASAAAIDEARALGRSPNGAKHPSTDARFGHDFSRLRVHSDERADTQPSKEDNREPIALLTQEPVLPRLAVKHFAAESQPDAMTEPDKSIAPISEFQDQSASTSSFTRTAAGVSIVVNASDVSPTSKHPDGFKFTQTINTNVPLGGATSPYVDPRPNDDTKPFYWTDAEQAANPTTFSDAPARPAPASGTTNWDAVLALNGVNEATRTVTAYQALTYGFSRDSSGAVTTRRPTTTSAIEHRRILSSEFPGWTFTWGLTKGEKGILGGAAVGAALGGVVGGLLGALVGAGIGAVVGGLGSLLF